MYSHNNILLPLLFSSFLLAGCSSGPSTTSSPQAAQLTQLPPLSYTPAYDFENDTVNSKPRGFDVGGPVVVTDELARNGSQSVKMTRESSGENVRLRQHFGPSPAGFMRVSLFVPTNAQADTFVTLFQDSYRADPDRIVDVVFRANGEIRNREANGPVRIGTYKKGEWNDIEINWTHMPKSNGFSLLINGEVVGHYRAERAGMVPARLDIKYGATNSPTGPASLYLDALTIVK
jgi:hypothetical protein